jgi:hypothetical protein
MVELQTGWRCKPSPSNSEVTPYLPLVTELGISEAKAGNRAQTDGRYGLTLVLTGSTHGETEPRKATYWEARHNIKTLTSSETKSRQRYQREWQE